jgi:hypothetical protein
MWAKRALLVRGRLFEVDGADDPEFVDGREEMHVRDMYSPYSSSLCQGADGLDLHPSCLFLVQSPPDPW